MNTRIESSLKVAVSATLAMVLTLVVMTGISSAPNQQIARQAALSAQSDAAQSHFAG